MTTIKLTISGMSCGHCVSTIEKALSTQSGVHSVNVDLATKIALIDIDSNLIQKEQLIQVIQQKGFDVV